MEYSPQPVPQDDKQIGAFLTTELQRIADTSTFNGVHLNNTKIAPDKPREGDLVYSDGTAWNPGYGKGFYEFNGSTWKPLTAIESNSVVTAKIADNAITQPKLADNSVGTPEIIDANVTTAKIANASITQAKLAPNIGLNGPMFIAAPVNVAVSNAVPTIVPHTEVVDTHNCFASNTFTPTVAGYYHIHSTVRTSANAESFFTQIFKNGTGVALSIYNGQSTNNTQLVVVSDLILMNGTTDALTIRAICSVNGSGLIIDGLTKWFGYLVYPI